jgi:DNA-binding transcriptional regulator YdaS (Cro superfamily)
MMDINGVINRLGGRDKTAELCGITEDAVTKWHKIGIPSKHWDSIVTATESEISFEFLARLRRTRLEKSAA